LYGFFEAWQDRRMIPSEEEAPGLDGPETCEIVLPPWLPPWPSYPSLGCVPAEPNSVSQDEGKYTKSAF